MIHRPISAHSIGFVKLKVRPPKPTPQYINTRTYRNYSAELFTHDLDNEADSLLSIFEESDVDSKLNILDDLLRSVLNSHAPIQSIKYGVGLALLSTRKSRLL